MLSKIAPRFVIQGVIQNAYYANYMAVDLTKQIFGQSDRKYKHQDPKRYFECNFFGYLSKLPPPTQFTDQFEKEKYIESCQKFVVYNDIKEISDKLDQFVIEIKELFKVVEANNSSSNLFARSQQLDQVWESDLIDCLNKYNAFLQKLQAYPQWKDKVVQDVGKWFHMINNNLAESDIKTRIFSKMNRQDYFV